MVNKIISVMIFLVIGLALLPVINGFAYDLTKPAVDLEPAGILYGTTTGSLVDLLPVIYVIILLASAVTYVVLSKKQ